MKYDKIVRDRIPEIIRGQGKVSVTYIAEPEEAYHKLKSKLEEEIAEFQGSNNPEELADLLEVIYALADYLGLSKEKLEEIRGKKCLERGGFKERIVLTEVLD
ncbi:MAG: nucleoside triphosphate pyrophosphohydrolase [Nanoarchaeota archaeon]